MNEFKLIDVNGDHEATCARVGEHLTVSGYLYPGEVGWLVTWLISIQRDHARCTYTMKGEEIAVALRSSYGCTSRDIFLLVQYREKLIVSPVNFTYSLETLHAWTRWITEEWDD